jgi:hypothetical protein
MQTIIEDMTLKMDGLRDLMKGKILHTHDMHTLLIIINRHRLANDVVHCSSLRSIIGGTPQVSARTDRGGRVRVQGIAAGMRYTGRMIESQIPLYQR